MPRLRCEGGSIVREVTSGYANIRRLPLQVSNPYPVINESITVYPAAARLLQDLGRATGLRSRHIIALALDRLAIHPDAMNIMVQYIEDTRDLVGYAGDD